MATFGTFTVGQVLTAAELNAAGAWTTFTPSWTNLTVGNATQAFKYSTFNKIMFIRGTLTFGTTTTMGTAPTFTIPTSATATQTALGVAQYTDTGTATFIGLCRANSTAISLFNFDASATNVSRTNVTATAPHTWANTDVIDLSIVLEIA